jgi:hypothetical protein
MNEMKSDWTGDSIQLRSETFFISLNFVVHFDRLVVRSNYEHILDEVFLAYRTERTVRLAVVLRHLN